MSPRSSPRPVMCRTKTGIGTAMASSSNPANAAYRSVNARLGPGFTLAIPRSYASSAPVMALLSAVVVARESYQRVPRGRSSPCGQEVVGHGPRRLGLGQLPDEDRPEGFDSLRREGAAQV